MANDTKPEATDPVSAAEGALQGEGDYRSARKYQKEQHEFAKDEDRVSRKAREAEQALDGAEGDELEAAREQAAAGRTS